MVNNMIGKLLISFAILAMCVAIRVSGIILRLQRIRRSTLLRNSGFLPTRFLIGTAGCLIVMHLAEMTVWALYYWLGRAAKGISLSRRPGSIIESLCQLTNERMLAAARHQAVKWVKNRTSWRRTAQET